MGQHRKTGRKGEHKNPLKHFRKTTKKVKELNKAIQDGKMEKGNNKEITKGDNPRDRKAGKEIRNYR